MRKTARAFVRHAGFVILAAPRTRETARVLIVIPKKVGNAPTRNKLRRQIKSIFYEEKLFERGNDWVVIVKPAATHLSFAQIKELLLKASGS